MEYNPWHRMEAFLSTPKITFWAHSGKIPAANPKSKIGWQPLAEHLKAVGGLAAELAWRARPNDERLSEDARIAGLLHDFGKYSDSFQRMLETGSGRCQHAIHGAIIAAGESNKPIHPLIAMAIAGHHAGIPDFSGSDRSLSQRCKQESFRIEAQSLAARASGDSVEMRSALESFAANSSLPKSLPRAELDLYIRMIFSCLVDADRLNSAGRKPEQLELNAGSHLQKLRAHLDELSARSPDGVVKAMRAQVLADCLQAAGRPGNLFSLSVPTGGGKTLAAMAFALQRAVLHPNKFRRIIVVIPYLSIIEQNARIYADVFGKEAVLEHHSGSVMQMKSSGSEADTYIAAGEDEEEERFQKTGMRAETENWDAPLIVTTSARFFESLFSNRPKDLRRAHNIAGSIVIFDEVQTLPRRLLSPLLKMQKELADRWGVNFVFATATQPAFEQKGERRNGHLWPEGTLEEIVREPEPLRKALVRAHIHWELETPVSWKQVAQRAIEREQCLVIVNLRAHASELYSKLMELTNGEAEGSVFHLSTRMCAAHRLRVLDQIRALLTAGKRCRVVSTQLIEAGVDVDFPLVMRAIGPLDSIIQAAGRSDREGKLTAQLGRPGGEVVVFLPEDNKMPPHEYKEAAAITQTLAAEKNIQVDCAEAMRDYFARYYNPGDTTALGSQLNELRDQLKFASMAEQFEYINSRTKDVFVPDDEDARAAIEELRRIGELTWKLRCKLQRHTVGLNPTEFDKARTGGVLSEVRAGSDLWMAETYNEKLGLISAPGAAYFMVTNT